MKKLLGLATIAAFVTTPALAGPLSGVERQIDRNGAMSMIEGGDGADYAATEGNDVLLGDDTIGIRNGQGGTNANDSSVVGPWQSGGCTHSTRIDLPGSEGSTCD